MENRAERTWYLYMLRCEGGSLYTGITTDPARRVREHLGLERGGARYTRAHRPVGVAAVWEVATRSEAAHAEFSVKRLSRADKDALVARPESLGRVLGEELGARALPEAELSALWPA